MGLHTSRLSARKVQTATRPGRYADGQNLYLNVTASGARSFVFLYKLNGKQREMGLGSAKDVTLAEARERAAIHRHVLASGVDPMTARSRPASTTFGEEADRYIAAMESDWRNPKHRAQWRMTLAVHAKALRSKPIDQITTNDVLEVLEPIWASTPETARRLRGRIEAVLNAAKARGLRTGENPAQWRGHLDNLLPKKRTQAVKHHAALAWPDLPAFLIGLRSQNGISSKALEFAILTAARSGEVLGALWNEVDLTAGIWTVPGIRMKSGREHRVPLSKPALVLLESMKAFKVSDFIFPGAKPNRPLSVMALEMVIRRMKVDATPHGFRSTFRGWAEDMTSFSNNVCEMALAHAIGSKVEAAYRRGDLFEKRRALMAEWGLFCASLTVAIEQAA